MTTEPTMTVVLTDRERVCLCALARVLLRASGDATRMALDLFAEILDEVFGPEPPSAKELVPYRESAKTEPVPVDVAYWMDRANKELSEDEDVWAAARGVTRKEAQQVLYDVLYSLARVGSITAGEAAVLKELRSFWKVEE